MLLTERSVILNMVVVSFLQIQSALKFFLIVMLICFCISKII
jgi:hypothetical protein